MDPHQCVSMPVITTITIGIKGQIVIPKEARDMLHLENGAKLVLVAKPDGIMLFPADQMKHFLDMMQSHLVEGHRVESS